MKESYSVHEFSIQKGEKPAILISEHECAKEENGDGDNALDCRNAQIEIDLPEFHIEFFLPEDVLRELAEKAQEFLGEKKAETQDRAESEEVPVQIER